MTEYVHVGNHAEVLANGRMIGPGDRVTDFTASTPAVGDKPAVLGDEWLIDAGRLVDIASFDPPKAKPTTTTGS